ncbi:hypothetical protein KQI65_13670 [bacterium]|nr:hypothetical protein [bacterium]
MTQDKLELVTQHLTDLMDAGWTVAAISRESTVNQITLGNIKNRKATRVTDKVYQRVADFKARVDKGLVEAPTRGRKAGKKAGTGKVQPTASAPKSPTRTPRAAAATRSVPAQRGSIINNDYVPVNASQLGSVIDRLIDNFSAAIAELESIRKQLG